MCQIDLIDIPLHTMEAMVGKENREKKQPDAHYTDNVEVKCSDERRRKLRRTCYYTSPMEHTS